MHRALGIPEVVQMICMELGPPKDKIYCEGLMPTYEATSLIALARTSTIFRDPALDVLWFNVTVHRLLIYSVPPDLWEKIEDVDGPTRFRPTRAMTPNDWIRPHFYSTRARVLRAINTTSYDFIDVFATVALCPPPPTLFPNLHTVNWKVNFPSASGRGLPDFRSFLGPRLASLSVGTLFSGPHLSLLPHIAAAHRELKKLAIKSGNDSVAQLLRLRSAISILVCALPRLESLDVISLDTRALEHVGRLPTLRSLTLREFRYAALTHVNADVTFPVLEALTVHSDSIKSMSKFISLCSDSPVQAVDINFFESPDATEMLVFYTTLSEHCSHASLRQITVRLSPGLDGTAGAGRYSLEPLLDFPHLTTVELSSPNGFDLDDGAVLTLARAWPHLEELVLRCAGRATAPHVTLEGIRTLAQHCLRLRRLHLFLDATVVPSLADRRIRQDALQHLEVESSPIATPTMSVAKFLSATFTNLTVISTAYEDDDIDDVTNHLAWKEVEGFLPDLLEIREQERRWARLT
ncbi:hypothetical protein B0H16DRAFT_1586162 [Mycena metata]|uniref:F-box domain-containing protein n=1 Tax=Mycena metata TaxID=1033252 RepID=A0AAD7HWG0_9AGAR|nr:hypothetical protein B0H16DRAFT_1586162 [Mycena metata]